MQFSRFAVMSLALLIGAVSCGSISREIGENGEVILRPDDSIRRTVMASPRGTTFIFEPGIYRQVTIEPRNGQRFIGKDGAILNGAKLLRKWRREGLTWSAGGADRSFRLHGKCLKDFPLCKEREDLFVDGELWRRVGSLADLRPGTWFYNGARVHLIDDPAGRTIELSVTNYAFMSTGDNVEIRNLVVEKYVPGAQDGAISLKGSKNWKVIDVVSRWNHGVGILLGDQTLVRGGAYIHNGQMGMRSEFGQATIENVEIAHNNYAGYDWGWEGGGTKFLEMTRLEVRGNCVHSNTGPGLWTDANNANVLYENNLMFNNEGDGLKHEISYNAVIRNNVALYNGTGYAPWLWGAQIMLQNSSNSVVENNIVETDGGVGNGITIIHQDRKSTGGRWITANNIVRNNKITLRGSGRAGMGADFERSWFYNEANNRWQGNTYEVFKTGRRFFHLGDGFKALSYAQNHGHEDNGTVTVSEPRPKRTVTCADVPKG